MSDSPQAHGPTTATAAVVVELRLSPSEDAARRLAQAYELILNGAQEPPPTTSVEGRRVEISPAPTKQMPTQAPAGEGPAVAGKPPSGSAPGVW